MGAGGGYDEIHAFIREYMFTLCLKAFVYSFKTFYKLEKTPATVFCFMSNYKYEKIVCYVCILDQFPGSMTCSTFKSIPFKEKNNKKKQTKKYWEHIARGGNKKSSNGIEKNCHRCK